MKTEKIIQGRKTTAADIDFVRQLIKDNPCWHRMRLSVELATIWNWRDDTGRLKDMACRTFMLKLHRQGTIVLPPPLRSPAHRKKTATRVPHSKDPVICSLKEVLPLDIQRVLPATPASQLFRYLLCQYHYLDYRGPVGKNVQYLVFDKHKRPLACLLFGAAAWQTAPRDRFIGWSHETRAENIALIAANSRFLILPWVRIPYLASYLLGSVSRRISSDWAQKYNHPVCLLETFVEKDRFQGTCYKAANWQCLGETTGRTRNGQPADPLSPIKKVYVYPLHRRFRDILLFNRQISKG